MSHSHAVVWIDHSEAHVLHFTRDESERTLVHAHGNNHKVHHRKGTIGSGKAPLDTEFFSAVAASLHDATEVLVVGPANAKVEFRKYADAHERALAAKILAVEPADHPTDGALLEHARKFFLAADRMRPQS